MSEKPPLLRSGQFRVRKGHRDRKTGVSGKLEPSNKEALCGTRRGVCLAYREPI
jgi:hypothetical protein